MNIPFPKRSVARILFLALFLGAALAHAEDVVQVTDAWTKATVPGQKVAGIYMKLVSKKAVRLNGAKSPVASKAELHVMRMEGGVMTMRRVPYLELAAGKPVTFEPGGYHVMFFGLKVPLKAGDMIPLTLDVAETGKSRQMHKVVVYAQVRPATAETAKPERR